MNEQSTGEYILMPEARTYALGLQTLQEECIRENNQNQLKFTLPNGQAVYRPNTFKENCLARLHQFNTLASADGFRPTLEQRTEFMQEWNDSSCGIAYPAEERNNSNFKLILQSPELISLPEEFSQDFISVDYNQLACTRELDRKAAKYNKPLTPAEIDTHEGWLTLFEGDTNALRDYREMIGEVLALKYPQHLPPKFMAFWLLNTLKEDQLRAVSVNSIHGYSYALGNGDLTNDGSYFLHRKP